METEKVSEYKFTVPKKGTYSQGTLNRPLSLPPSLLLDIQSAYSVSKVGAGRHCL